MKTIFAAALLLFICKTGAAQIHIAPVQGVRIRTTGADTLCNNNKPVFVVFSGHKEIMRLNGSDTTALQKLNPLDIESVMVLKDVLAVQKYGMEMNQGIVEVYMKDGKYPKDYTPVNSGKNK